MTYISAVGPKELMVLPEGALHVYLSHQVWPQRSEPRGIGASANVAWPNVHKCVQFGKTKGLNDFNLRLWVHIYMPQTCPYNFSYKQAIKTT